MFDYLIVGAGFAGSVLAERLARGGNKKVLIIDKRNHIAGNAYDYYNKDGILIHKYGPHIFHTNSKDVFLLDTINDEIQNTPAFPVCHDLCIGCPCTILLQGYYQ